MSSQFLECEGVRENSRLLLDSAGYFIYNFRNNRNSIEYFKCQDKSCPASASRKSGFFTVQQHHNHTGNRTECDNVQLRAACKQRAKAEATKHRMIFDQERRRFPESTIGFAAIEKAMQRSRLTNYPSLPSDADEAGVLLRNSRFGRTISGHDFFSEKITASVGEVALVFLSGSLLALLQLGDIDEIHADATFKVVPDMFYQLFTLHVTYMDMTFPVAYVLMSRKSERLYVKVLEYLHQMMPGLDPSLIITDFEVALQNAFATVYPSALVKGCWFHYGQALWKKARSFGLESDYRDEQSPVRRVIKLAVALALLPVAKIQEGFRVLRDEGARLNNGGLNSLLAYIEAFWIQRITPDRFSVHGQPRRTNNGVESFHRRLQDEVHNHSHPSFWFFMERLQEIEYNRHMDYRAIVANINALPRRKSKYLLNDGRIAKAARYLESGRFRVIEFLEAAKHSFNPILSSSSQGHVQIPPARMSLPTGSAQQGPLVPTAASASASAQGLGSSAATSTTTATPQVVLALMQLPAGSSQQVTSIASTASTPTLAPGLGGSTSTSTTAAIPPISSVPPASSLASVADPSTLVNNLSSGSPSDPAPADALPQTSVGTRRRRDSEDGTSSSDGRNVRPRLDNAAPPRCPICLDRKERVSVANPCGHTVCTDCSDELTSRRQIVCHICRAPLNSRTPFISIFQV